MKKGYYIKQDADELLTGEISNEDCAVFKAYYQLKAMCFKKELKDSHMTFKQAVRVYSEEVINVLIDEDYVFRIIEDGLDYLLIPSITIFLFCCWRVSIWFSFFFSYLNNIFGCFKSSSKYS